MAPTLPSFNPARLRSYLFRLPLFTRIVLLLIVVFWILEFQSAWDIIGWGGLVPKKVGFTTSEFLPTHGKGQKMGQSAAGVSLLRDFSLNVVIVLVYRLNTYPLIHINFLHALLNAFALVPLMERFEAEHGTLLSAAMFTGRTCRLTLLRSKTGQAF